MSDTSADEAGVRAVFDAVMAAWADNDADDFAARYTETATVVLPGFHLPGRAAIHSAMAEAFGGPLKGSRRIHEIQSIRFPADHIAIVISRSATVPPDEAAPATWSLATWVLTDHPGHWQIEAYHDCPT
jgi:uncharacterized protein (TIGR02246 family)